MSSYPVPISMLFPRGIDCNKEGGGKVEEEGSWRRKTGTETDPATTIGVAEEATIALAGDNRACSNGGCGENECSGREGTEAGVPPRQDPFAMDIDHGRNCYACGGFGHMARHCRNRGQRERVAEERRLEYREGRIEGLNEYLDNLKEVENLESLD